MALAVLVADLVTLLIPLWIILGLLILLGTFVLLGRVQNGRYIRPVVMGVAKVPLLRRGMERASNAALERSNPELASAMKKIQRYGGATSDPLKAQQALSRLSSQERRALLDVQEQQGIPTENLSREQRRRLERAKRRRR